MLPWFFALSHTNYACWLPVHLRDMSALQQTAPGVFLQFEKGVVHSPQVPKAVFCYCYRSGARTEQWGGQRGWWGCGPYIGP